MVVDQVVAVIRVVSSLSAEKIGLLESHLPSQGT